jgi:imidazolonepropionase-like amidohydrolase
MRLAAYLLCLLPLSAAETFFIQNVTVHPVTSPDIANASVYVENGKIAGIGAKLVKPKNVRIIEGKGLHLYPGMINSGTEVGLTEISSVRETSDSTELGVYNPQLRAVSAVNPASEHFPVVRANGIATVMTIPQGGVISGQAALIHMDGWTWEEMAVKRSAAMHLRFPTPTGGAGRGFRGAGARPSFAELKRGYEKSLRELDEFFEEARRYRKGHDKQDLKFEAMIPVLEGKLPVIVSVIREREILAAIQFAGRQKIRIVLAGIRKPGKALAEIKAKNIPVILGKTLALPLQEDDPYDDPATLAAELYRAGVKFAFATFDLQFVRNLPFEAANAVAYGLPYEEALKAVTINAAEIWGVSDLIGSIENGKLADLILTDGDPLETKTQIKQMFIAGRAVDLQSKHYKLYQKYMSRP